MIGSRTLHLAKRHLGSFVRHNTFAKSRNALGIYRQFLRGDTKLKGYPIEVIVDPINVCGLKCPLCVTGQRENKRSFGKMEFEEFKRIVDELATWLYKLRFYSWGEPLLHDDIYRMIAYTNEQNMGTELSSNLQTLGPGKARDLIESGLELLVVSLDGASEESYSKYRRGGDFEKVVENVRELTSTRNSMNTRYPIVEIQFLVMKHNENEIDAIKKLAGQLDVERVRLAPVIVNVRDPEQVATWLPVDEKWSRYNRGSLEDKIFGSRKRCAWLWRSAVINWDSTVSPCCVFEGPKTDLGSLKENSFSDIWNNEQYQAARSEFRPCAGNEETPKTICSMCKGKPNAGNEEQQGLY